MRSEMNAARGTVVLSAAAPRAARLPIALRQRLPPSRRSCEAAVRSVGFRVIPHANERRRRRPVSPFPFRAQSTDCPMAWMLNL